MLAECVRVMLSHLSVTDEVVAAIGIPIKHLEQQRPVKVAPAQLRCVDFECPP
jgi:hypothetical protein